MAHMSTKVQDSGLYSQKLLSVSCSVFKQLAGTMEVSELFPRKKKKSKGKQTWCKWGEEKRLEGAQELKFCSLSAFLSSLG